LSLVEWFQAPIAPWFVLLGVRLFSFAMLALALERALGTIWHSIAPAFRTWRVLWNASRDGERISLSLSLLRVQAEVAPPNVGLSFGRSAALALGLVLLLVGLAAQSAWTTYAHDPPLSPARLVFHAGLTTIGLVLGWVSPTARAREQAELRARRFRPLEVA
jgi:hypothetical protein